jgi:hypothetical protein
VSGGSKTTTTTSGNTSQATTLPQWMTDAAQQTYQNASNAVSAHPTQAYQGQMTPGMTANQTAAGNLAASSVGTGQSDLAAARDLTMASTAGPMTVSAQNPTAVMSGAAPRVTTDMWSQDAADRYMNPYLKTVQGNTLSTMRDQDAQDVAQLNDQIAGANAFGGTRGALMQTETQKNQQRSRQDYVDKSTADAYTNAQQVFSSDQGRKLSADQGNASLYDQMLGRNQAAENAINVGNADRSLTADTTNANGWQQMLDRIAAGGRTMGDIGTSSSNLTGADISRLEGTGATAQQTQGAADSAAYNDWLRTQNGDVDQYKDLMAILAGAPRNVSTTGTSSGTSVQKTDPGLIGTALGLGQLGVSAYSAGMFSDRRLKRDVRLIETRKGLGIYSYRYLWESKGVRHIGVMAQEVARIMPSALGPRVFGHMTVNYRKLLEGGLLA